MEGDEPISLRLGGESGEEQLKAGKAGVDRSSIESAGKISVEKKRNRGGK